MHKLIKRFLKSHRALAGLYYSTLGHHAIEGARWLLRQSAATKKAWRTRSALLVACPDNARIPRVESAGRIKRGCLIMHNGVRVRPDSYYNYAALRMMQANRGVHEPQEEAVFREVLRAFGPGSTMVELGAYWAFYSIWFAQEVPGARLVLLEPSSDNLEIGQENCRLNGCDARFVHAFAGGTGDPSPEPLVPMRTVDELIEECQISRIDLLHVDIQGAEARMLLGCRRAFEENLIAWMFISTHSPDLHRECLEYLESKGWVIVAEHAKEDSYSGDGLIVAKRPGAPGPDRVPLSRRRADASTTADTIARKPNE